MIRWIKKLFSRTEGAFVDVVLDYDFQAFSAGHRGATTGPYRHTLHVTDLAPALTEKALTGKRFDWHVIPSHWRHDLEIKGFHAAKWDDVKMSLRGD